MVAGSWTWMRVLPEVCRAGWRFFLRHDSPASFYPLLPRRARSPRWPGRYRRGLINMATVEGFWFKNAWDITKVEFVEITVQSYARPESRDLHEFRQASASLFVLCPAVI